MTKKLFIEENLLRNISFEEVTEAINHIDDEEYWLSVTQDDMNNINIAPKTDDGMTISVEFELNLYDDLEQVSFEQLLDQFNITAYELAKKSEISNSHAYQFLRGDRNIKTASVEVVDKIAKALGLNIGFMVDYLNTNHLYITVQTDNDGAGDEELKEFKTLEEANDHAEYLWHHLTESEKEKSWVYVFKVSEATYHSEKTDAYYEKEFDDNFFDSKKV